MTRALLALLAGAIAPAVSAATSNWLRADPADVSAALVTIENDKFFAGSDRHYTQGLRVQFTARRGLDGPFEERVGAALRKIPWQPKFTDAKATFSLGQDIFTPEDTGTPALLRADRPYAGWLYLATGYQAVIAPAREDPGAPFQLRRSLSAELTYGVVGPHALGEEAQNGWHDVINVPHSEGWRNQLGHEIGLNAAVDWRFRFRSRNGRLDLTPHVSLALGNVRTHLAVGAAVRLGLRLPDDFGPDLIRPAASAAENAAEKWGAYLFVSGEARAVARDIFLDGNSWKSSHSVRKRPVVADLNAGFSLRGPAGFCTRWTGARGWLLTYAQNYRTKEFHGQPKRNVFGSVSLGLLY
jgi:hypothetical protein